MTDYTAVLEPVLMVAGLPDAAVFGGDDPVGVDQSAAAVVATIKL